MTFKTAGTLLKINGVINHPQWNDETKINKIKILVVEHEIGHDRRWSEEVSTWITSGTGHFSVTDCYRALQAVTGSEKSAVRVAIKRLVERNVLAVHGERNEQYRKVESGLLSIDWKNAASEEFPVIWPLKIHDLVKTFPGSTAVIAGEPNAGKTRFCFNFILANMGKGFRVNYFTSELSPGEVRATVDAFGPEIHWDFNPFERSSKFSDVIEPGAINVIDYIPIHEEFYLIGKQIDEIHNKLKTGIALVCIQKDPKRDMGRGGIGTLERPRLYVALNKGWAKIIKAKSPRNESPDGLCMKFGFDKKGAMIERSAWHEPKKRQFEDTWDYLHPGDR